MSVPYAWNKVGLPLNATHATQQT